MTTVSQAPKIDNVRKLNIRNLNLFFVATLVVIFIMIFASGIASTTKPVDYNAAYILYRQGEWLSVPIPAGALVDMKAYHLSERTLVDQNAGLSTYLLSEHTLVDPHAGIAAYFNSERTSIPALFTKYQRSEWFGK